MNAIASIFAKYCMRDNHPMTIEEVPEQLVDKVQAIIDAENEKNNGPEEPSESNIHTGWRNI